MKPEYYIRPGVLSAGRNRDPKIKYEVAVEISISKEGGVHRDRPKAKRELFGPGYRLVVYSYELKKRELRTYMKDSHNCDAIRAKCEEFHHQELGSAPSLQGAPGPNSLASSKGTRTPENSFQGEEHTPRGSMEQEDSTRENSASVSIQPPTSSVV